jgi:hypothetical protein
VGEEQEEAPPGRTTRLARVPLAGGAVLVRWSTWDPPWQREGENASYALPTAAGPVLVDPEAPAADQAERLWALLGQTPVAIVLTTGDHERDAFRLGARCGAPVWAPAAALPERGGDLARRPDAVYGAGDAVPGGLEALALDGAAAGTGAHALRWATPGGQAVLFTGDVLTGGAEPSHPEHPRLWHRRPGLYLGPGPTYLARCDPDRLRVALGDLLAGGADWICGGHGVPAGPGAGAALVRLLTRDWPSGARLEQPIVVDA